QAETRNYAIVMNKQNQPEVKREGSYSTLREKDRKRKFDFNANNGGGGSVSFNNSDELVSRQNGTAVFGTATYLPPYGKVSGFDDKRLKERGNAVNWIHTTHPGLIGYSYAGVVCRNSTGCPQLVYKTRFSFDNTGLAKNAGMLDSHPDPSRENSPIYKLKDYPWLGVSFNLGSENTVKNSQSSNRLISSFSENNNNQTIVSTTESHPISLGDGQREHTAVVYYLNAKLHLLNKKQIQNITDKTVQLGVLKPSIDVKTQRTGFGGILSFWASWDIKDTGQIPVKLGLQQVKAGRCVNANNPNKSTKAPSPALTAPALWFGPVQNGKVQMYSASVSTYPDSSSSRIYLQNLKRKDDPGRPGRYSLATLNKSDIESREPTFTGRQTVIRLDKGVHQIKLKGNEVEGFKGNNGNDTFGIVSEGSFMPDASEWKKVLLPWTVRGFADDSKFKAFNKEKNNDNKPKYSQRYRIRENGNNGKRDLGDIVNSPIVAVGEYLATSANDGMVHIFKKGNGGDARDYSLKLSYIPGTMPRKDIQSQDSTLAKELRAFAEKGYVGDRYGVDGGFVLRQVNNLNGQDRVFMFGAMGFGGRGAYALDLTKADGNDPTKASLFDVKDNGNNGNNGNNRVELGYTVGTPQIGKTHNGKYAAFLASGYATKEITSGENKTALYVYDLENNNGTPIAKIEVPNGKGGLSSPTLVDKDLDGT
ncbi:TPA: PilC family type IV pilus tip adhesin, partial [Neisseria meningitidis]